MVGMGFDSNAIKGNPTPFSNLAKTSGCSQKVFSFWFSQNPDDASGGELTLCGTNDQLYTGEITYVPVSKQGFWQFNLDSITVLGGTETNTVSSNVQAIADTGAPFIAGPNADVMNLYYYIGVRYGSTVDCKRINTLPTISFTIGGKAHLLNPSEYVLRGESGKCAVGIVTFTAQDNAWVLGTSKCLLLAPRWRTILIGHRDFSLPVPLLQRLRYSRKANRLCTRKDALVMHTVRVESDSEISG